MSNDSDLVDEFVRGRQLLLQAADAVPAERRTTPLVGRWNLMDMLAHLVGWDYTNVRAIDELLAGTMPSFYERYDPGWATFNEELIDRYGEDDWQALRASLLASQATIVARLHALTPEEMTRRLTDPARRRPVTIAGILNAAIKDERGHLEQLQTFVRAGH